MKRRHLIILSVFLLLGVILIIISIYISSQTLRQVTKDEQKPLEHIEREETSAQISLSPAAAVAPKIEAKPAELEFDLEDIPEDYSKEAESKEAEETLISGERKLETQPSLKKLKELKTKRVVIY